MFRWRDGRYQFAPAEPVDYDRENFIPMSADFILMEGIRMVDEWPIIEKRIPSFDIVFRPVVDPSLIEVGAGAGPEASGSERRVPASATGRIRLTPEEERVFRKVDGVARCRRSSTRPGRGVRGLPDAFRLPEPQHHRPRGPRQRSLARGSRGGERRLGGARVRVAALVVSLALAGLLVQRRSPFAVTGLPPVLHRSYTAVLDGASRSRLARLERAVEAWRATHGAPPAALEDLVRAGLVDRSYLHDPWSRPFHYETSAGGYLLSAVDESGASRRDATLDRRGGR